MLNISVHNDLDAAKHLWLRHWPQTCLFDLWSVRDCFQSQFNQPPYFLVATQGGIFRGMLALSWIDETMSFGHFPGEVSHGQTWLEQNKILASNPSVFRALLDHVPAAADIRYLNSAPYLTGESGAEIDETGYLFFPKDYDYSFQTYMQCFSGRSRKKIGRELDCLTAGGVTYRHDCDADVAHMFRMNLESFKEHSYFADPRFLTAFEHLAAWLRDNGLLRVTTVLIRGEIAAVDIGAVWNDTYTVLAGGARPDFPGVAKLINFHHLEWSCHRRFRVVDFLCGEFNWKNRFHLTPRHLYKIVKPEIYQPAEIDRKVACAA